MMATQLTPMHTWLVAQNVEPNCYGDVVCNAHWEHTMDEEMVELDAKNTQNLVLFLENQKATGCRWWSTR